MTRTVLLAIALVACEKSTPAAKPTEGSAADGSGSAVPSLDDIKLRDTIVADTIEYSFKTSPILLAFDGDCSRHADRLLALEPLAKKIRENTMRLMAGRADHSDTDVKAKLLEHKDEIMAKINDQLAAGHKTIADVEAMDAEIRAKCGDDPKVKDAMERTGVFKRKKR